MNKKKLTLLIALSISMIIALVIGASVTTADTAEVINEEPAAAVSSDEEPPQEKEIKIEIPKKEKEEIKTSSKTETVKKEKVTPKKKKPVVKKKSKKSIKVTNGKYTISKNASSFKSWMPYTAITNRASAAYKLQKKAYTDKNGLRKVGDDYCVAMGTYYSSTIGDRFKVTMSTGKTFTVIISDVKANRHTDSTNRYTVSNGCMMEFLVDRSCLNPSVKRSGSVSSIKLFSGKFAKIEKLS